MFLDFQESNCKTDFFSTRLIVISRGAKTTSGQKPGEIGGLAKFEGLILSSHLRIHMKIHHFFGEHLAILPKMGEFNTLSIKYDKVNSQPHLTKS